MLGIFLNLGTLVSALVGGIESVVTTGVGGATTVAGAATGLTGLLSSLTTLLGGLTTGL